MKHLITILAITIMATSCSTNKTLVAYFSATGNTKAVAEKIAAAANADIFEITPETLYTEQDLNWRDAKSRSSVEMADIASRPAIGKKVKGLSHYETIYVGFPIWWYTAPRIINTFFEENDFSGKSVKLFATSGSSSISNAYKELREAYPDVNWLGAKLMNNVSLDEVGYFVQDTEESKEVVCGGFSSQRDPSEEEIEIFRKVMGEGDVIYTPIGVSTQVVAGLNYEFWCKYEDTKQGKSGHMWVTIYKNLEGELELTSTTLAD